MLTLTILLVLGITVAFLYLVFHERPDTRPDYHDIHTSTSANDVYHHELTGRPCGPSDDAA